MRLFLRIVLGIVVLVVLFLAFVLVPPHIQVRQVEPPLPDEAELRALLSLENGPVRVRYVVTSSQQNRDGRLGHTTVLIEWANGNSFMIDAGMDGPTAIAFGKLMEFALGAEEAVSHGTIAELLGDDLQHVVGVAFTHLHLDHSQGVVPFCESRGPGATVYQTSWQAEEHNFNTKEAAAMVAESCLRSEVLASDGVMTIEGFPGLGIVALGGHTPGSTLFAIASEDRLWLLSGDTTNSKADLLSDIGKGFLYSYFLVPENTNRTRALRSWFARLDAHEDMTVVVSHDLSNYEDSGMVQYVR